LDRIPGYQLPAQSNRQNNFISLRVEEIISSRTSDRKGSIPLQDKKSLLVVDEATAQRSRLRIPTGPQYLRISKKIGGK